MIYYSSDPDEQERSGSYLNSNSTTEVALNFIPSTTTKEYEEYFISKTELTIAAISISLP
jgi:hypothetical protein